MKRPVVASLGCECLEVVVEVTTGAFEEVLPPPPEEPVLPEEELADLETKRPEESLGWEVTLELLLVPYEEELELVP